MQIINFKIMKHKKQMILNLLKLKIKFESDPGAAVTFETKYSSDGYPLFLANYNNDEQGEMGVKIFMYEDNFKIEMYDYIRDRLSLTEEGYFKPQTIVVLAYDEEDFDKQMDWKDFHKQTIKYLKS